MQKIMFNDKFGLTQAVLEGRKTQTRRIITCPKEFKGEWVAGFYVYKRKSDNAIINWPCMYDADEATFDGGEILPKYKIGEVVAIAQSYESIYNEKGLETMDMLVPGLKSHKGWRNKLFVAAGEMIHHIRITGIRVEKLQDIPDEDCLAEGIEERRDPYLHELEYGIYDGDKPILLKGTSRNAYADLIDKVSGKGTWGRNPYVFVYEFELID